MRLLLFLAAFSLSLQIMIADLNADIKFNLYTRGNLVAPNQIWVGNISRAPFIPSRPTKFIVHGFKGSATDWVLEVKDKFLAREDCNVVTVDWASMATGRYAKVRNNVPLVGSYVGRMYDFLATLGLQGSSTHCVGHSLGAHVCGFSGKEWQGKLGRVTGLDPALPLFFYVLTDKRLDKGDAVFVDVIHTSAIGFNRPVGHADFYPNPKGLFQPGCTKNQIGCSHSRSFQFFLESIESDGFVGRLCSNAREFEKGICNTALYALMGNPCDPSARGTFFLATNPQEPFARKQLSQLQFNEDEMNL